MMKAFPILVIVLVLCEVGRMKNWSTAPALDSEFFLESFESPVCVPLSQEEEACSLYSQSFINPYEQILTLDAQRCLAYFKRAQT